MKVTPCDDMGPYASGSGVGRTNRSIIESIAVFLLQPFLATIFSLKNDYLSSCRSIILTIALT